MKLELNMVNFFHENTFMLRCEFICMDHGVWILFSFSVCIPNLHFVDFQCYSNQNGPGRVKRQKM